MDSDISIIYLGPSGALELRGDPSSDTIWANLDEIARLFGRDKSVISRHFSNIFHEGELRKEAVVAKKATTAIDGKVYQVEYYNLDGILSVGYRVNSKTASHFRQWATTTLRAHILEGYTINPARLEKNYSRFLEAVDEMQRLMDRNNSTIGTSDALELIRAFSSTWFSLDAYDTASFPRTGDTYEDVSLFAEELIEDLQLLKSELMKSGETTELFAEEIQPGAFAGIIGNVFQSFAGENVYLTLEEKAAHLLYFIIKNHVFHDGNKRSGAFAFVWFLRKVQLTSRKRITPEALTALTLLIAESNPKEKDRMTGLILLLLGSK